MPNLGTTEIIIIAIVIMVLFGAKRLPDAARALGRSARILKAETKGMNDDDAARQPVQAPRYDPHTGKPLDPQPGSSDRLP